MRRCHHLGILGAALATAAPFQCGLVIWPPSPPDIGHVVKGSGRSASALRRVWSLDQEPPRLGGVSPLFPFAMRALPYWLQPAGPSFAQAEAAELN